MKRYESIKTLVSPIDGYTYRLFIETDEDAESPREWDNVSTIITWADRYSSPDVSEYSLPVNGGSDIEDVWDVLKPYRPSNAAFEGEKGEWEEVCANLIHRYDAYLILPLCHNELGLSETYGYANGYAFITRETILREWGKKNSKIVTKSMRESALKCLRSEISTYNDWVNGDVYGYVIDRLAPDQEEHENGEDIDSCWGFYGYSYAESEGESALIHCANGDTARDNARNNSAMPYLQAEAHGQMVLIPA